MLYSTYTHTLSPALYLSPPRILRRPRGFSFSAVHHWWHTSRIEH